MKLLGVFLLSLLSCGSVDTNGTLHLPALASYEIILDADVDNLGGLAVDEGVKQWTTYAGASIVVRSGRFSPLCFPNCFALYEVDFTTFNEIVDGNWVGETIPGFIFIARGLTWDVLQETVIHEMGHMLGLMHPCIDPCFALAVMNPDYQRAEKHVGCLDVEQYQSERLGQDAGVPLLSCSDAPGAFDEAADGGPAVTP
jgi:hypothetical protein